MIRQTDAGLRRFGGLAQLARAPALQAGGQRFESVILHPVVVLISLGIVNTLITLNSYPPEIFDILTQARL